MNSKKTLRGPHAANRNTAKKGFTLVEVFLVAMLFGVLLMTIFSAYVAGARIWKFANESSLLEDRRFHISTVKIKRELKGYIRDFGTIVFEGDETELSFPGLAGLDIVKVTYVFDKNRKSLLRKTVLYSDSLKDKMNEKITELFDAEDVRFAYLFSEPEEGMGTGDWSSGFSEEDIAPAVIRLDIKRNGKESDIYVFLPR